MSRSSKALYRAFVAAVILSSGTISASALQSASNLQRLSTQDVEARSSVAPSVSSSFVLGPGDQLTLHVADVDEITDKPIRIDPDGGIDLPLIGRVQAAGLTLSQLKAELSTKLSKYVDAPQVSINLTDNQSRPVSVVGEVNAPGVHQLPGPRSLIEVISLAGGVKPDAGSKIVITRAAEWGPLPLEGARTDASGKFTTATLSLDDLMAAKTPANNIVIKPQDVISIPKGEIVYVVGDVRRAGGFPLASHETITILQALSLAEGLGPDPASQRSKILRQVPGGDGKPLEIAVDVRSIFAGKSPDVPMFAGDILFVPTSGVKSGSRRAVEAVLQVATGLAVYGR